MRNLISPLGKMKISVDCTYLHYIKTVHILSYYDVKVICSLRQPHSIDFIKRRGRYFGHFITPITYVVK